MIELSLNLMPSTSSSTAAAGYQNLSLENFEFDVLTSLDNLFDNLDNYFYSSDTTKMGQNDEEKPVYNRQETISSHQSHESDEDSLKIPVPTIPQYNILSHSHSFTQSGGANFGILNNQQQFGTLPHTHSFSDFSTLHSHTQPELPHFLPTNLHQNVPLHEIEEHQGNVFSRTKLHRSESFSGVKRKQSANFQQLEQIHFQMEEENSHVGSGSNIQSFENILSSFRQNQNVQENLQLPQEEIGFSETFKEDIKVEEAFKHPVLKKQKSMPAMNFLEHERESTSNTSNISGAERDDNRSNFSDPTFSHLPHNLEGSKSKTKPKIPKIKGKLSKAAETIGKLGSKLKQRRVKWTDEDIKNIWQSIAKNGNEWRIVQHDLPKRTYHQVKDKGRRLLRNEAWQTGKCKKDSDIACEVAKEIAQKVLERIEMFGTVFSKDEGEVQNTPKTQEVESDLDIGIEGMNLDLESLPFDLEDN